jgi:glycosyltransferase involved in cell wall biosynthesis
MIVNLREDRIDHLNQSDPLEEYARSLNLSFRAIRVRSRWDRTAIMELQQLLAQLNPDLVHVHSVKGSTYLSRAKSAGLPVRFPIVSTHHGVHGLPDLKSRMYEWFYRKYVLHSFDRVLSVSRRDYEFMVKSGFSKERLRLHLNGIDGHFIAAEDRPREIQRVRALWLPDEVRRDHLFLMAVVGRLSAEKDHVRVLRVLSELNRLPCQRDWRLLVFGAGPLENALRRMVQKQNLEQRVFWMGYRNGLGDELVGLDLLLSFSNAEGLPINVIEAGWASTPVMSTFVGGVQDLIPDESYGVLVSPNEAPAVTARRMRKILSHEGQAALNTQGTRFQERVMTEFTQAQWLRRLAEIYAELYVAFNETKPLVQDWSMV